MPSMWVADQKISGVYVGNQLASAVYRGTEKVWPPPMVRQFGYQPAFMEDGGPTGSDLNGQTGLPKDLTTLGWTDLMYSIGKLRIENSPRVIAALDAGNYRSGNCYKKAHTKTGTFTPSTGYDGVYPWTVYNQWFNTKIYTLPDSWYSGTGIGFALRIHSSNNYAIFFKLLDGAWKIYAGTAGASSATDGNVIAEGTWNASTWGGQVPAAGDYLTGWVCSQADGVDNIAFGFYKDASDSRYFPPGPSGINMFHRYDGPDHPQKSRIRYSGYTSGNASGPMLTNNTGGKFRSLTRGAMAIHYRDVPGD